VNSDRILLTGASGFIGHYCLKTLIEQGFEVHAISRQAHDSFPEVAWHTLDLNDDQGLQSLMQTVRPTQLLHLAWYAEPGKYWHASENLNWVQNSLRLFQYFQAQGGQRILAAGSCLEYDMQYGYCSELSTPRKAEHLYGTSKHALHLMAESWAKQIGLSFAWAHLFYLYGPGEPSGRLVPAVFRSILNAETIRCSHGRQIKDFLHVADIAEALVAVLKSELQGPVNIGSGQPISIRELVLKQIAISELNIPVEFGAIASSATDPAFVVANIKRLREEVGWSPRIEIEEGLRDTFRWWRKVMNL
jgi:nucleoside-diphosphate-sugar epimerase